MKSLDFQTVTIHNPDAKNFIFGQSHFIKTVEDIHETLAESVPGIKFGIAFAEASGPRKIRTSGTDDAMIKLAVRNTQHVACGHTFFIFMENAFPINVLPGLKSIAEIVTIFCATANPTEVVIVKTSLGRGVCGIVDGGSPLGVEDAGEVQVRKAFLRKIGYKL